MAWRKVSLTKLTRGSWEVRWREAGRRFSQSFPPTKEGHAAAIRFRKAQEQRLNAEWATVGTDVSWQDFIVDYLEPVVRQQTENTQIQYTATLGYVNAILQPKTVRSITPHDIEIVKAHLRESGLRPETVNKHLRQLRRLFEYAVRWDLRDDNPARKVDLLKKPTREITVAKEDDLRRVLAACPTTEWHRFFRLAWCLGLRAGDLRHLEWDRVDLGDGTLTHWDAKTQKDHPRPLPPDALAVLREWTERKGPLFPSLSAVGQRHFYTLLDPIWQAAGVDVRLHDFRRGLDSRLAAAGFHPSLIAAWMGQTPETVLRYYTRVDELRPVADAVGLPDELPPAPGK